MESKKLPRVLKAITTILMVITAVSFVIMIGIVLLTGLGMFSNPEGEDSFVTSITLPIYFVPDVDSYRLASDVWGNGEIVWASGEVKFESTNIDSAGVAAEMVFWFLLVGIPIYLILLEMRRIFGTMVDGTPFIPANVNRIRWVAGLLIAVSILAQFARARLGELLLMNVESNGLQIVYRLQIDPAIIVIGMIIFSLAEVFRYGLALQTEADLTV